MQRVTRVVTRDTGRDIAEELNRAGEQHGFEPVGLLGGAIAESNLHEHAVRERAWPDVSYGLWQPAVKWIGREVAGVARAADGTALDTPENRRIVRDFSFDAAKLTAYVAPRYAALLRRWGDPLEAWCRWNKPAIPGAENPHRHNYIRGLREAEAFLAPAEPDQGSPADREVKMRDLRGQLPTNNEASYMSRPVDAITGITLHYTAGPATQTVQQIARWQTSDEARANTGNNTPFPGIAYTILVENDGTANLCHDLTTQTWHSAARVNGIRRNLSHVGICYTGNDQPNPAQIRGLAEAIHWVEQQVGRRLSVEGHRDAPYATACPGAVWSQWRTGLEAEQARLRGQQADGFNVGEGFRSFLAQHPEWGRPRMDEMPMEGGAYVWTTPTAQHPKGGLLIYRRWLNEVRALGWE